MSDRTEKQKAAALAAPLSSFAGALLDPDIAVPENLAGRDGTAAGRRYSVYRNNVVVSLMGAMRDIFPSLLAIMGDDNFDRVARGFIALHPPQGPVLAEYGDAFAEYLAGYAPLRQSPFLADVARAERAWLKAYHAADAEAASAETLGTLAPDSLLELQLAPHPAMHLICSQYPVFDLFCYRFGKPENGVDLSVGQNLLVTRPLLEVQVWSPDDGQSRFLSMLVEGATLGEAAVACLEHDNGFDINSAIALALNSGAFLAPAP